MPYRAASSSSTIRTDGFIHGAQSHNLFEPRRSTRRRVETARFPCWQKWRSLLQWGLLLPLLRFAGIRSFRGEKLRSILEIERVDFVRRRIHFPFRFKQ